MNPTPNCFFVCFFSPPWNDLFPGWSMYTLLILTFSRILPNMPICRYIFTCTGDYSMETEVLLRCVYVCVVRTWGMMKISHPLGSPRLGPTMW